MFLTNLLIFVLFNIAIKDGWAGIFWICGFKTNKEENAGNFVNGLIRILQVIAGIYLLYLMYDKYLMFKENRAARVVERERLDLDKQIERI